MSDRFAYEPVGVHWIRRMVKPGQDIPDHWQDSEPDGKVLVPLGEMTPDEEAITRAKLMNALTEGLRRERPGHHFTVAAGGSDDAETHRRVHARGLHGTVLREDCPDCFPNGRTGR
jgi:hypothetical protein